MSEKKTRSKKSKVIIAFSRRKEARARAYATIGNGNIYINGYPIDLVKPSYIKELILEPIYITSLAKNLISSYDININVKGGGFSGQAQAARSALAKVLVKASNSDLLKKLYLEYDRYLLVDDVRQVEPKKFLGPKARARFQTSYR